MDSKYECIVCGWNYIADDGETSQGIAPGTPFEDLPETFLCPECGVDHHEFEKITG